jgi:ubiquinone/menaquinone biosynthesis C-methylase UbiE
MLLSGAINFLKGIGRPIKGISADLGSGTGVTACMLSKYPEIDEVYAIEYSEQYVTEVMPQVFEDFHANCRKIKRVVGDFNKIQLPDRSFDLIAELGSYHHAEDLLVSAMESYRVLKPGGAVIAIDRGWPDTTPQTQLDAILDKEFSPELKRKYGVPVEQSFTRRQFGEHEHKISTWENTFVKAGFRCIVLYQTHPEGIPGANFVLNKLPAFQLSISLAIRSYKTGKRRIPVYGWAAQKMIFIFLKD